MVVGYCMRLDVWIGWKQLLRVQQGSLLWCMCWHYVMSIYWHGHEFPCQMSQQDIAGGGDFNPTEMEDSEPPPLHLCNISYSSALIQSFRFSQGFFASLFLHIPLSFTLLLGLATHSTPPHVLLPLPHHPTTYTHIHPLCRQTPSIDFPSLWHIWCSRMWPINYIHSRLSSRSPFPNNESPRMQKHACIHTHSIYIHYPQSNQRSTRHHPWPCRTPCNHWIWLRS